jgi:enoyl-[acyl-carrier protein] reductase II
MDTESVVTGAKHGHAARCLKNVFTDKFLDLERVGAPQEKMDQLATGTNRLAAIEGDVVNGSVFAGQSLVALKSIRPAKEIIESIYNEAVEVLNKASGLLK